VACFDCFKRGYYGDDEFTREEPVFPYSSEIEEEYYSEDDLSNPKWKVEYPLIEKYQHEWNEWDDKRMVALRRDSLKLMCSTCRSEKISKMEKLCYSQQSLKICDG
jgi:hypothetical protein